MAETTGSGSGGTTFKLKVLQALTGSKELGKKLGGNLLVEGLWKRSTTIGKTVAGIQTIYSSYVFGSGCLAGETYANIVLKTKESLGLTKEVASTILGDMQNPTGSSAYVLLGLALPSIGTAVWKNYNANKGKKVEAKSEWSETPDETGARTIVTPYELTKVDKLLSMGGASKDTFMNSIKGKVPTPIALAFATAVLFKTDAVNLITTVPFVRDIAGMFVNKAELGPASQQGWTALQDTIVSPVFGVMIAAWVAYKGVMLIVNGKKTS